MLVTVLSILSFISKRITPLIMAERTFIAVKPDGVQRGLVGDIIKRFEAKGFKLAGMKFVQATEDHLREHYADLSDKPFFAGLVKYMASAPLVAMCWQGTNVVKTARIMMGETKPFDSKPGTIRGDFCIEVGRNIIHGSDSVESANKEIALWFKPEELVAWTQAAHDWIYEFLDKFSDLNSTKGLNDLNSYLEGRSYIRGYIPSRADVEIYKCVGNNVCKSQFINVYRWHKHIASLFSEAIKESITTVDESSSNKSDKSTPSVAVVPKQQTYPKKESASTIDVIPTQRCVASTPDVVPIQSPKTIPQKSVFCAKTKSSTKPKGEKEKVHKKKRNNKSAQNSVETVPDAPTPILQQEIHEYDIIQENILNYNARSREASVERLSYKEVLPCKYAVLLDIKAKDADMDIKDLEDFVRKISMEGMQWGASQSSSKYYGPQKLSILCTLEDDKASIQDILEKLNKFENYVNVDIAGFHKL